MSEYTRDDIIIFSDDKRLKDAIGKECYFSDSPNTIILDINKNKIKPYKLECIESDTFMPFLSRDQRSSYKWHCLVIKKEEPKPEYVPFESADEFLNAYENSKYNVINVTRENKLISCGGIWLKSKSEAIWITQCINISDHGVTLGLARKFRVWKELFDGYRFLDGTPCGKKKE